ncbi:MAG: hypothetical protein KKD17_06220 [Nanoarchaeota archaeon]|nr:hypothetical protein [Nanoarchaeota archaeon]
MDSPYFEDMDRETRRHVDRMRLTPHYGVVLNITQPELTDVVLSDIRSIVPKSIEIKREGGKIYFAGPMSMKTVQRVRRYVDATEGVNGKAYRGEYGFFMDDAWLDYLPENNASPSGSM